MIYTNKAKIGYRVIRVRNEVTGEECLRVYDGDMPLFVASERSFVDFQYQMQYSKCFMLYAVFATVKGNQFIYWRDEDIDADYITKIY